MSALNTNVHPTLHNEGNGWGVDDQLRVHVVHHGLYSALREPPLCRRDPNDIPVAVKALISLMPVEPSPRHCIQSLRELLDHRQ